MSSLQNLIPDPSTPETWQSRPASILAANFAGGGPFSSGFSSGFQQTTFTVGFGTGFISCILVVGNLVFGMISTQRNPGNDEPFCFNLQTNGFVTVSGVTAANTPTSPPQTGDWTPPQMEIIGSKVVVCHSGFSGVGGNFFGWFDISTPTAPSWHAGNFSGPAGLVFTVAPTGIAQFSGRAYYIHNAAQPGVIWSDVLNPLVNTGTVTPVLTFGDTVQLTAIAGLPLNNQLGGIIQSLMVFKGASNIFQITGDAITNNLASNSLNVQTGTFAANSLTPTPKGLAFIAPDGLRVIDFLARVSDPIGIDGKGVNVPFQLVVNPTRINMACNSNILRVSLLNGNLAGAPAQEYWYDFARGVFHGPHTFPASMIAPFLNTFIMSPIGVLSTLWRSDSIQSLTSTFVENGKQLTWMLNTPFLPSTETISNNEMHESSIELAFAPGTPPVTVAMVASQGNVLDSVTLAGASTATIWGSFLWGSAVWGGVPNLLAPRQIPWTKPNTFNKMQVQVAGQSAQAVKISRLELRYGKLRSLVDVNIAA
ncbi:MAG TPA: hypothetical protein VF748_14775 [Candidatus Acidoferrum sp.]